MENENVVESIIIRVRKKVSYNHGLKNSVIVNKDRRDRRCANNHVYIIIIVPQVDHKIVNVVNDSSRRHFLEWR